MNWRKYEKSGILAACLCLAAGLAGCSGTTVTKESASASQETQPAEGSVVSVTLPAFLVQGQTEEDLKAADLSLKYTNGFGGDTNGLVVVVYETKTVYDLPGIPKAYLTEVENGFKNLGF